MHTCQILPFCFPHWASADSAHLLFILLWAFHPTGCQSFCWWGRLSGSIFKVLRLNKMFLRVSWIGCQFRKFLLWGNRLQIEVCSFSLGHSRECVLEDCKGYQTTILKRVFFLREQISLFVSRGQTMPMTHLCLLLLLSKEFRHLIKWRGGILMLSKRGFQGYKIYSKSCFLVNLLSSSTITGYGNSSEQHKGCILKPDVAVAAQKL